MKLRRLFFCDDKATKIVCEMMLSGRKHVRSKAELVSAYGKTHAVAP